VSISRIAVAADPSLCQSRGPSARIVCPSSLVIEELDGNTYDLLRTQR
jgi:hypothetical protein